MSAGGSSVFIKLATAQKDAFAYLQTGGLLVGQVAALACKEFPRWCLDAGQVRIHLVAAESAEEPDDEAITAALATAHLSVGAAVTSGAWLVAVPTTRGRAGGGWAVEIVSAKVDATSGELRTEIEALRLAEDFSFVSPSGKQYVNFVDHFDSKIGAWLAEQCGLKVLAAQRGLPQSDGASEEMQWDARFSVQCPAEWSQEQPPSALMYTYGGGQYSRPDPIQPRQISPTKPLLAEYFAVLEYTRFPGWTSTWKNMDSGQVRKALLPRLETRMLVCIQRAGAAGVESTGILDLVAVVGVVGEDRCQESVEESLSKADCPHVNLRKLFLARRFVFFNCVPMVPSGAAVLLGAGSGGGASGGASGGGGGGE